MQSNVIGRRNILRVFASATALAGVSALGPFAASAAAGRSLYRDAKLPVELRVKDLLSQMTLEEKVAQTVQADIGSITPDEMRQYHLGSILAGGNSAPGGKQYADAKSWLALADEFHGA